MNFSLKQTNTSAYRVKPEHNEVHFNDIGGKSCSMTLELLDKFLDDPDPHRYKLSNQTVATLADKFGCFDAQGLATIYFKGVWYELVHEPYPISLS